MVDLWIKVDRYLLCACQHGNTSSVDSTGTGSCGAGQSDTLCLTWINKQMIMGLYIYNGNFLLSFNNFSEFATKATTVCWFPAGVRRSAICFCLNKWFSDFNLASKPQLQMCNQSHSTAYENVKKKESCSVMQMHNLLWKEYFNVTATTLPFYRAPDIVSWNYNFHELGNKKDHIWADGCIIQCYLNHTSQLSFLYNVHLIII